MDSKFPFSCRWVIRNFDELYQDYITGHPYITTNIKKKLQLRVYPKGTDQTNEKSVAIEMSSRDYAFNCDVWIEKRHKLHHKENLSKQKKQTVNYISHEKLVDYFSHNQTLTIVCKGSAIFVNNEKSSFPKTENKIKSSAVNSINPRFQGAAPILLTHKWTIQMFEEIYQRINSKKKYILSDSFSVGDADKDPATFYLILEPRFKRNNEVYVAPYLHYKRANQQKLPIRCEFSILDKEGCKINSRKARSELFRCQGKHAFEYLCRNKELFLFSNREKYLPNDTLTILCQMVIFDNFVADASPNLQNLENYRQILNEIDFSKLEASESITKLTTETKLDATVAPLYAESHFIKPIHHFEQMYWAFGDSEEQQKFVDILKQFIESIVKGSDSNANARVNLQGSNLNGNVNIVVNGSTVNQEQVTSSSSTTNEQGNLKRKKDHDELIQEGVIKDFDQIIASLKRQLNISNIITNFEMKHKARCIDEQLQFNLQLVNKETGQTTFDWPFRLVVDTESTPKEDEEMPNMTIEKKADGCIEIKVAANRQIKQIKGIKSTRSEKILLQTMAISNPLSNCHNVEEHQIRFHEAATSKVFTIPITFDAQTVPLDLHFTVSQSGGKVFAKITEKK